MSRDKRTAHSIVWCSAAIAALGSLLAGIPCTAAPAIVITNPPTGTSTVTYETVAYTIGATNDGIVGEIGVVVNGAPTNWLAAANPFETNVGLVVGPNSIALAGTNDVVGGWATAAVTIVRRAAGTGAPFVDSTNEPPPLLMYDTATYMVAGTNNAHVVGTMWVSNATVGGARQPFGAGEGWMSPPVNLATGINRLVVYGTNAFGTQATNGLAVTRGPQVLLLGPDHGTITNTASLLLDVYYSGTILSNQHWLSTNAGVDWFLYTNMVTFADDGIYYWTACGFDVSLVYFAPTTNRLIVATKAPVVRLITPVGGSVLTNRFAINLLANFGMATLERQLSTNAGATWFDYMPGVPVAFPSTGTWQWTARARNEAGWGYAPATNQLTLNNDGTTPGIYLLEPAHQTVTTNSSITFTDVTLGDFVFHRLSTNNGASFDGLTNYPHTETLTAGVWRWTANLGYGSPAFSNRYAPTTNTFEVLGETKPAVRLLAPEHTGGRFVGMVTFDVLYLNVNRPQLSTNNGAGWFDYVPIVFPVPATIFWTARGTNAAGAWVYANMTNKLTITGTPFVDITNAVPPVQSWDVASCLLAGTNNGTITGPMWWRNEAGNTGGAFTRAGDAWTTAVALVHAPTALVNQISVYGTNVCSEVASDSIEVTVDGEGSGSPFVDITNAAPPVQSWDTASFLLGGTNNVHVEGEMWWSNTTAGVGGGVDRTNDTWTAVVTLGHAATAMTNRIFVYGTNLWGQQTNDSIAITVGGEGTGVPFVDITNEFPALLSSDTAAVGLAGTNNAQVEGVVWWSNTTANTRGTALRLGDAWTASVALVRGMTTTINRVSVYGTNLWRQQGSDTMEITIDGQDTNAPFLDITNAVPPVLSWDATSFTLGGTNNANVAGDLWWSNITAGTWGTIARTGEAWEGAVELSRGTNMLVNQIMVYGTNIWLRQSSDSINITVGGVGTGKPFIDVTNKPAALLMYDVDQFVPAGTNNSQVVGAMWVTNATAGGGRQVFAAAADWVAPPVSLVVGANRLVVYGTNAWGVGGSNVVMVSRGPQVYLVAPVHGTITNEPTVPLEVYFSSTILPDQQYLSTNAGVNWFNYTNMISFAGEGTFFWTAYGFDTNYVARYATATNQLTIVTNRPKVALLSPLPEAVLTNQFAVHLLADYGATLMERQLSTNNGAAWFTYSPGTPVCFPGTGTWQWTARGRNLAGWGYAAATNRLTLASDGTLPAISLLLPGHQTVMTNSPVPFSVVVLSNFTFTSISTNNGASFLLFSYPGTLALGPGVYKWTARGTYGIPPINDRYAPSTNTFEVLGASNAAVRLLAPEQNGTRLVGTLTFDVLFHNVGRPQLSTNNGAGWFDYAQVDCPTPRTIAWTARGTNAAGAWVYANSTNSLAVISTVPLVDITNKPVTVASSVTTYTIGGTNNAYVVGGMWWTNLLNGGNGTLAAASSWQIPGIGLDMGANELRVVGTNSLGTEGSDSVIITREGLPFVNITNENTDADTFLPFAVAGTNNLFVVGTMWISNAANGQRKPFPASASWVSDTIALEPATNVICVFGTNVVGMVTNDTVVVMGIPEASGICVLAAAFLVLRKQSRHRRQ